MSKLKRRLDIQRIRSEKKITQKELAKITGYPQGFISKMEHGKVSTPESFIEKIRDFFEIPDIETYVSFTKPLKTEAPSEPEVKKPNVNDDEAKMSDKQLIQRLFKLLDKRENRIEKLEKEIDQLHRELSAMRLEMSKK